MVKTSRLAIVGAGIMGRHHLKTALANPEIEVVGVSDPDPAALQQIAAQGIATFTDHLTMIDHQAPDGVLIATPNSFHAPIALDTIRRGLATLIEKPVADTLEAAQAVFQAQQDSGAPVLIGHHRRHNPLLQAARQHIAEGGLGRVTAISGLWLRRKPDEYFNDIWKLDPKKGGGVILINAVHDFDSLRMLCGDIESICAASSNTTRGFEVEDTAAILLRFRSGALATLTVSDTVVAPWCWEMTAREDPRFAHVPENSYLICGTEASLTIPTLERWSNSPNGGRDASFRRQRLYHVPADSMTLQMAHFARVMRRETGPMVDISDGMKTLAATLAVARSASSGKWVHLD
ncbi:MAG: Gfo/Idh/MocA family protein [Pseudorhodobacter sp.]